MLSSKSAGATINHQLPILLLPPQGMLHCFAVCWSMQQQQHYAPANNPTCSTTLAPAGCCWQGCPERHTGPSPCWQLWQQAASASQQNMHKGEQVAAQGGRSRIAKAAMVDGQSWSHGQGSRFLGWTATTYIKIVFTIKY